jgi:hypothetical protein
MSENSNILSHSNPQRGILVSASTGNSHLLQSIIDHYSTKYASLPPGKKRTKMSMLCPKKAIVIAAKRGHSKIVKMIFIHLNYLLSGYALLQAAKEGHSSVISTILNLCPRGGLPYELSYGEIEQELQGQIIETFRRDGWDPDSESWKKLLDKCQQTRQKEETRTRLLRKVQRQPKGPFSKDELSLLSNQRFVLGMI